MASITSCRSGSLSHGDGPEGDERFRLAAPMVNRCVRRDDRRRFPGVRPRRDTWLLRRPLGSGTARRPRRRFRRDKPSSCPAGRVHARSTRYATCPATRPGSLPCSCPSTSLRSVHPTTPTSTQPDRTSYQWYFGLEKQPIGRQLRCATISIRSVTISWTISSSTREQDLSPLTLAEKPLQSRQGACTERVGACTHCDVAVGVRSVTHQPRRAANGLAGRPIGSHRNHLPERA